MVHVFDVEVAKEYGILEAVLLNHIHYWIEKNRANKVNFHDGTYWTYNSVAAFCEMFPYATLKKIRNAIEHLRAEGLILTGNYNTNFYDRTLWYALSEKGASICLSSKIDLPYGENRNAPEGTPIPDIIPDKIPDSKPNSSVGRFTPPTVDEVRAYCIERHNNVDADRFVDFYTMKGWMVGKSKMKNWKAAVRTWERSGDKKPSSPYSQPIAAHYADDDKDIIV